MKGLEVDNISVTVAQRTLCNRLTFAVKPGQIWAVLGRNGVGKSSLLHCLAGLRPPVHGTVSWNGQPLQSIPARARARSIGLLTQDSETVFPVTVLETVLSGRHPQATHWWRDAPDDQIRAREALRQVDMAGREDRLISTLSGGERRRVEFAALLCQDPTLWLLDEPANHLDIKHQVELFEWVRMHCRSAPRAAVVVTHDLNAAARYCDHCVLLMGDGTAITGRVEEALTEANLNRAFEFPMRRVDAGQDRFFVPGR